MAESRSKHVSSLTCKTVEETDGNLDEIWNEDVTCKVGIHDAQYSTQGNWN